MNSSDIANQQFIDQPDDSANDLLENRLRNAAKTFPYPPTPAVLSTNVRQQLGHQRLPSPVPGRLAWGILLAVLVLSVLIAVSPARATVAEVLRQGAVRLFLLEPTPGFTPFLTTTPNPAVSAEAPQMASPQSYLSTPHPSATPISARVTEHRGISANPTVQVTLPAELPIKPNSSF